MDAERIEIAEEDNRGGDRVVRRFRERGLIVDDNDVIGRVGRCVDRVR